MRRYTVKLMRKYGADDSKPQQTTLISSDADRIKQDALLAAKLMRDKATDGGFYTNDEFYGVVARLGDVLYEFNIDDGGKRA